MDLSNLSPPDGARKNRKRKGRGPGSGKGKTAGRGEKGQRSRSGGGPRPGFEGGQMPLQRRVPKRGFTNIFATDWSVVNIRDLERCFEDGAVVDADALADRGLIWNRWVQRGEKQPRIRQTHLVKILGKGQLSTKLTVKANKFSQSAAKAIAEAGGEIEVL